MPIRTGFGDDGDIGAIGAFDAGSDQGAADDPGDWLALRRASQSADAMEAESHRGLVAGVDRSTAALGGALRRR